MKLSKSHCTILAAVLLYHLLSMNPRVTIELCGVNTSQWINTSEFFSVCPFYCAAAKSIVPNGYCVEAAEIEATYVLQHKSSTIYTAINFWADSINAICLELNRICYFIANPTTAVNGWTEGKVEKAFYSPNYLKKWPSNMSKAVDMLVAVLAYY